MSEQFYLCRSCRHEFRTSEEAGSNACPRCGSIDTLKYDPSSILSFLAARLSGGGA